MTPEVEVQPEWQGVVTAEPGTETDITHRKPGGRVPRGVEERGSGATESAPVGAEAGGGRAGNRRSVRFAFYCGGDPEGSAVKELHLVLDDFRGHDGGGEISQGALEHRLIGKPQFGDHIEGQFAAGAGLGMVLRVEVATNIAIDPGRVALAQRCMMVFVIVAEGLDRHAGPTLHEQQDLVVGGGRHAGGVLMRVRLMDYGGPSQPAASARSSSMACTSIVGTRWRW